MLKECFFPKRLNCMCVHCMYYCLSILGCRITYNSQTKIQKTISALNDSLMDSFSDELWQPWHVNLILRKTSSYCYHHNIVIYNSAKHLMNFIFLRYSMKFTITSHYYTWIIQIHTRFIHLKTLINLLSTKSTQTLLLSLIFTARPKY